MNKKTYFYFAIVFVVFFQTCTILFAQQFKQITADNGLSNKWVLNTIQDDKKFIWIATISGIDRFDGIRIKNYNLKKEGTTRKIDLNLRLYISDKKIYSYSMFGLLFYYNPLLDQFVFKTNISDGFKVSKEYVDFNNNIWFCCENGIYVYNSNLGISQKINNYTTRTHDICQTSDSLFWIGTNTGLLCYNNSKSTFISLETKFSACSLLKNEDISIVCAEKNSTRLWLGTRTNGVFVFNFKTNVLTKLPIDFPKLPVLSIIQKSDNEMFVAVSGAGLYSINTQNLSLKFKYIHLEDEPSSLVSDNILDVYKDRDNCFWISFIDAGVTILNENKPKFTILRHIINNNNSLSNNMVKSILEDNDGKIWFGTNNGISIFSPKTKNWTQIQNKIGQNPVIGSNIINTFCKDSKDIVWVGMFAKGISSIRKVGNNYMSKTFEDMNWLNVRTLFVDSDNDLWFNLAITEYNHYSNNEKKFIKYPIQSVNAVVEYKKGLLYIGSDIGIFQFSKSTKTFTELKTVDKSGKPVYVYRIFSFLQTSKDSLWICSELGLYLLDMNTQTILYQTNANGLFDNTLRGILRDSTGRLWIARKNGLTCFDPKTEKMVNFNKDDGLPSIDFLINSNCYSKDGTMYFGTNKGVTVFRPSEMFQAQSHENLLFTDFKMFYQSVAPGDPGSPLKNNIDDTPIIHLKYNQNSFTFEFAAVNFTSPNKISYSWKLEGFNKEWSPPTLTNSASYTNINPGKYIFRLKTVSNNASEANSIRTIIVIISPPFWKTMWAYLFYILIISILTYLFLNYQKIKNNKKQSEEQIRFFINAAHDIKTPLTLIRVPLEDNLREGVTNEKQTYRTKIALQNVEKLQNLVVQLLDLRKIRNNKSKLHVTENYIVEYLIQKLDIYKPVMDAKGIKLTTIFEKDFTVWFDIHLFDKIIDNLLTNAIKYTNKDGNISIELFCEKTMWHIEIADDGIGIPKDDQHKIFELFYRAENAVNSQESGSGVGLLLIRNLIKQHKGKIQFTSEAGKGSKFQMSFLYGNKHFKKNELFLEPKTNTNTLGTTNETIEIIPLTNKNQIINDVQHKTITLLIVEDNNDLRNYMVRELNLIYNVVEAINGKDGLVKIKKHNPDIIISDVLMPEMNGIDFCNAVKQDFTSSHIPMILLTALHDKDDILKGLRSGADDYITKPFDMEIVKAKLNNIVRNKKLQQEKFLKTPEPEIEKTFENELDQKFMKQVVIIIEKNISNGEFSVPTIADEIGMSRSGFYTKFKALVGQSPADYMRVIRMEKAAVLLKNGNYNVSEISDMLGFSTSGSFSICFKNYFGVSPNKYK